MAKVLVTGIAGFIGSHLAEKLLRLGYKVIGIDCLSNYYSPKIKERNIQSIQHPNLAIFRENLLNINLKKQLEKVDYILHMAAQAGVRMSWGNAFHVYIESNVHATQKLLEACKDNNIKKIIYASSSSIYGNTEFLPMKETDKPKPISPYGVTKLSAEHLCNLYWKNFGIPVTSLRYFTVYGPRQRPDMAIHKFVKAILEAKEITVYGSGNQTRDFTYVSDVVDGTIKAMKSNNNGEVINIAGGSIISVKEVIKILEKIIGKKARIKRMNEQKGDVKHTYADTTKARRILEYKPKIKFEKGLKREVEWIKNEIMIDKKFLL